MIHLLPTLQTWLAAGHAIAVATLVQVYGSAPRQLGAKLLVNDRGDMIGSVSGGCVEGAVVQAALEVLASGAPRLVEYGIADELAQSVGLTCGGIIQVWIAPCPPALVTAWKDALTRRHPLVIATPLTPAPMTAWTPSSVLHLGAPKGPPPPLSPALVPLAARALAEQRPLRLPAAADHDDLFLDVILPRPHLIIVGAVHIAVHLVELAAALGLQTTVLDPRTAFATPARFSRADALLTAWPQDALPSLSLDATTYVVTLSHDDKIDLPALAHALTTPTGYVGALGSRRTLPDRRAKLLELGVTPAQLARLHAPVGLDLGGRLPEEIALAILAQIVAVRNTAPVPA